MEDREDSDSPSISAKQTRLPPLIRHKTNKNQGEIDAVSECHLDESTIKQIFKIGLDGKDNVDKFLVSGDPEVRKFCRRIKMQRRFREKQTTDQATIFEVHTATEQQMVDSTERIRELVEDSLRSITNVRVAAIQNEEERQRIEKQRKDEIDCLIREETASALEKFAEINSKWEMISKQRDPLEIHEETEKQRDDCVALLEQKDVIIDNLKSRLRQADQEFYDELSKQNDYINILSDRINEQISLMNDCYREELQNLQRVINTEKDEVLEERVQQWREMAEMKEWLELDNISKRCDYLQLYEDLIDSMLIDQHELMRTQKMKLETKLNRLTLEENRFRSAVLINTELLNYNVQILQKRQDENRVIKGQQKRIVNKLQETVRRLRQQQTDEIIRLRAERKVLLDELKRTIDSIKTATDRIKMLATASDKRYFQLWDYNQEVTEGLINNIMGMDRRIHKELLNAAWRPPRADFSKSTMPSYVEAVTKVGGHKGMPNRALMWRNVRKGDTEKLAALVVESIYKRNDFLMDDHLKAFLKPFSKKCEKIITMHHIFETLGLKNKKDMEFLTEFFRPFAHCKQCQEADSHSELNEPKEEEQQEASLDSIAVVSRRLSLQLAQMSQITKEQLFDDGSSDLMGSQVVFDSITEKELDEYEIATPKICSIPGHYPTINFYHVSQALREFAMKLREERKWDDFLTFEDKPENAYSVAQLVQKQEVERFWGGISTVFPQNKKILWKSILCQVKDYYKMLLRRNHLKRETKKLQRQSLELRRLLMRYIQPEYPRENLRLDQIL